MRIAEWLDATFFVALARYRSRTGIAGPDTAWRRASNRISGLVLIMIVGLLLYLLVIAEHYFESASTVARTYRTAFQLAGGFIAVAIAVLLDRRFKKYQHNPLQGYAESSRDRAVFWMFHIVTVGTFASSLLVAMVFGM